MFRHQRQDLILHSHLKNYEYFIIEVPIEMENTVTEMNNELGRINSSFNTTEDKSSETDSDENYPKWNKERKRKHLKK